MVPGSPADQAGVRVEDLIVELAGDRVSGVEDIQRLMAGELIGASIEAVILRGGVQVQLTIVPRELRG